MGLLNMVATNQLSFHMEPIFTTRQNMSRKSRNTHDVLCVSHQIATKSLKLFTVFGVVRSLVHFMKLN